MTDRLLEIARQVGLKSHSELGISPAESEFAKGIVLDIMTKMEAEIADAYQQDELHTATTLQALAIDILDHFDVELPEGE